METCEVTVWVLVDEDGNAVASVDRDKTAELYDEEVGNAADCARRMVCITLTVPKPAPVEMSGTVPDVDDSGLTLKVG